jgi:hypothetical protein
MDSRFVDLWPHFTNAINCKYTLVFLAGSSISETSMGFYELNGIKIQKVAPSWTREVCWIGKEVDRMGGSKKWTLRKEEIIIHKSQLDSSQYVWKILWHVDPLLGNDRETSNYTTVITGQRT